MKRRGRGWRIWHGQTTEQGRWRGQHSLEDEGGREVSYGPPWAHYLGGYQDRLLGGPLGLPDLRCTAPAGVKHRDYGGEVLG
jgi:hypothetical protein